MREIDEELYEVLVSMMLDSNRREDRLSKERLDKISEGLAGLNAKEET